MAMINEVRRLIEDRPFKSFSIVTSSGQAYRVASVDHIDIAPTGNQLAVWHDDGTCSIIGSLHITSIELEKPSAQQPA
jgi:hypothetical protein